MSREGFYIRCATADDVEAILSVERSVEFAPHWPSDSYSQIVAENELTHEHRAELVRRVFVAAQPSQQAEAPEKVLGFAVGSVVRPGEIGTENPAELEFIAVEAGFRRLGAGRLLCREVIAWARSQSASHVDLEVREQSTGAIALYSSLGFRSTGRRPNYYHSPDDHALLMRLALGPFTGIDRNPAGQEDHTA